jgi:hypothetical protein
MTEKVASFIDSLGKGANAEAGEAFKDALRDKVASALDQQRIDVAKNIFTNTPGQGDQATAFSDAKPTVLSPAERTDTIHDTQGNEIEFTDNGNTQPEPTADVPEVSSEPAAEVGGNENI